MRGRLTEIAGLFLKLGTIGFGGPATHLALMDEEAVEKRGWLTRQHYLDLIGATNLIPGPNSTEMAIHIGFVRGGWPGLIVAGICFILPAVLITTVFAGLYVQYGSQPQVMPVIAGIKPAVLAIIFSAGWRLGRKAISGWIAGTIAVGVALASLSGGGEITVLLCGSALGTLWFLWDRRRRSGPTVGDQIGLGALLFSSVAGSSARAFQVGAASTLLGTAAASGGATLGQLALFFLKVGAVLYGTGYVLIAYLQGGVVDRYGWLTEDQLLDAIAIGQFTPGPILSTATFIGYLVMAGEGNHALGLAGGVVATLGVFLPSFLLVAITNPIVPRLRRSPWSAAFLDAVNAASMGLMAAVTAKLAWRVFFPTGQWWSPSWQGLMIAGIATAAVLRWRVGAVWVVLGGAAAGLLLWLIGWEMWVPAGT
jgi:chromate transporter